MASTQKLITTAEGDYHQFYPGVEVSDFYVTADNCAKPQEKAQTGNEIKYSIPIALGTTSTVNLPLGNYHFIGNCFLRITGTRGVNHSPVNPPLPGMLPNKIEASGATFNYKSPTGNFLPMNGYDLIEEIQLTLPGDDYYTMKGEDAFLWLMSCCESEKKEEEFWKISRIDPAVDVSLCDEYPSTLLYGGVGQTAPAAAASDLMGGIAGRQRVYTDVKSVPFECILMMAFPWCSPNKDRRPKPFPTYKFGNTQQVTLNITWKKSEQVNVAVTPSHAVNTEEWQVIPSTCDFHFEYFNFANKSQLANISTYVYPAASLYPINFTTGALKVLSGDPTNTAAATDVQYNLLINGLRPGETSHLLITMTNETGETVIPSSFELNLGGQILFKQVDTQGKLAAAFELPYDDVSETFYDTRFRYIADASKYQGGDATQLQIVTTAASTAWPAGANATVTAVAKINLEKKAIQGLPILNYMMIPLGKNASSSNCHNYALGTRFDNMDTQLTFKCSKYYDMTSGTYKSPNISNIKIIQVMNSFWQFTDTRVKLYRG